MRPLLGWALYLTGVLLGVTSFAGTGWLSATTVSQSSGRQSQPVAKQPSAPSGASLPSGHWEIVNSPSPSSLYNYLVKVTCGSANDCWAVGSYYAGNHDQALIEHYDGTSWSVVPTPSPGPTSSSFLSGVSCLNANDCWAAGSYSAASTGTVGFGNVPIGNQPLVEHWDGTSWSIVTSPPGPGDTALRGVSCLSATDCWAVGHSGDEVIRTFVEHYDGTLWTIVPSPNQSSPTNALYAVTCTSSTDCWAVGQFFNTVPATCGQNQTVSTESLVEHYDGTTWSIVNAPYDPCKYNLLDKVACTDSSNCWAVGTKSTNTSSISSTLIQHFDGAAWSIVDSPNTDPVLLNYLYGVTCASPNDCWATGLHDIGNTNYRPMIQHYDGVTWSIIDSPNPDTSYRLDDVTCVSSSNCWAVSNDNLGHTFIEHYTVPVQLNAVVSRMTHGDAGTFDIDLPLTGTPAIECRSGATSGDYMLVFTFANPLTIVESVSASATGGGPAPGATGIIDNTDAHRYLVNLSNVPNAQYTTVTLTNVTDSAGNFSAGIRAPMGVLLGDVNGDGQVDSSDLILVKQQTLQPVNDNTGTSNFREDVNTDGSIDSGDLIIVKRQTLTGLP
jgi:Dockerin type I domain